MIDSAVFYQMLEDQGFHFFTGVPDSLLKGFCAFIEDNVPAENHVIAANEGGAVALACGHYLATGKPAFVYMQNSGLGNALNPLVSLADSDVYSIPLLLLIGWRGEPGVKDEPQHVKQGRTTTELLDLLEIPFRMVPETDSELADCLDDLFSIMKGSQRPVALVARSGSFRPYKLRGSDTESLPMTREEAIGRIVSSMDDSDLLISTTGGTSRELYEYRVSEGRGTGRDFLTIGSMGHSSLIAMGIAMARPDRQVYCLDGDGSALMHLGAMPIIGSRKQPNFRHIIFNNGAHDSVGGQPTVGRIVSFVDIALGSCYEAAWSVETIRELDEKVEPFRTVPGPVLLEVRVRKGMRSDLGRPVSTPRQNRDSFMKFIER